MIKIRDLSKQFDGMPVLQKLSLDIPVGRTTVILGPSGCGKTTLLNVLAGFDKEFQGTISGPALKNKISYCFQEDRLLDWMDLRSNIEFVLENKKSLKGKIDRILAMLGLSPYRHFPANKLSGGLRQRTSIARALAYPSHTVLMDEPFRSIDHGLKTDIFKDLNRLLMEEPRTMVIVTHDINDALLLADRVYILSEKPAGVLKKKDIPVAKEKRDLQNRVMTAVKKELMVYL